MKKIILFFCLTSTMLVDLKTSFAQAFEAGKSLVSAGYGFGVIKPSVTYGYWMAGFTSSSFGPVYGKYEYGLTDHLGVGLNYAYVNYLREDHHTDSNGDHYQKDESTSFSGLIRMNWHFVSRQKLDFYLGTGIGYRNSKEVYTNISPYGTDYESKALKFPFGFETTVGIRFLFISNLGVYVEAGIAKSAVQTGLCGKF